MHINWGIYAATIIKSCHMRTHLYMHINKAWSKFYPDTQITAL